MIIQFPHVCSDHKVFLYYEKCKLNIFHSINQRFNDNLPVGIPNSVLAFCTDAAPARIASRAFSKSSADHVVGAALNGAASRIPSRLAILYNVEEGMPNAFEALFAEIVPVRRASKALLSESSFHVFVGPSFFEW